nr:hypothetical protein Iba_chr12cCG6320 [Ipomoea batatas]
MSMLSHDHFIIRHEREVADDIRSSDSTKLLFSSPFLIQIKQAIFSKPPTRRMSFGRDLQLEVKHQAIQESWREMQRPLRRGHFRCRMDGLSWPPEGRILRRACRYLFSASLSFTSVVPGKLKEKIAYKAMG